MVPVPCCALLCRCCTDVGPTAHPMSVRYSPPLSPTIPRSHILGPSPSAPVPNRPVCLFLFSSRLPLISDLFSHTCPFLPPSDPHPQFSPVISSLFIFFHLFYPFPFQIITTLFRAFSFSISPRLGLCLSPPFSGFFLLFFPCPDFVSLVFILLFYFTLLFYSPAYCPPSGSFVPFLCSAGRQFSPIDPIFASFSPHFASFRSFRPFCPFHPFLPFPPSSLHLFLLFPLALLPAHVLHLFIAISLPVNICIVAVQLFLILVLVLDPRSPLC